MRRLTLILLLGSLALSAAAQEMTTYYVAFLKKGPNWDKHSGEERKQIQAGHMANIQKMADMKKLILAGPFSDNGDLRGMFIFQTSTLEEAKALAEDDPAVKTGRMVVELHPWYSAKGIRYEGQ